MVVLPHRLITKFMTIVGCVVRSGMLAPPCAVPVKVEATVPVGAFPTALADIILFAPPVVAADTGPLVSFMHALASPPDGVYAEATEPAGV